MKLNITIALDIEESDDLGQVISDLFKALAGEYALFPKDALAIMARHGIESTLSEDAAGKPTGTIKISTASSDTLDVFRGTS